MQNRKCIKINRLLECTRILNWIRGVCIAHGVACVCVCSGRYGGSGSIELFSGFIDLSNAQRSGLSVKFNTHQRQKKRDHSTLYEWNEIYFNLNLNIVACLLIKSSSIGFGFTHRKPLTIKSHIIKKLKGDKLRPISLCFYTLCKQWAQAQTHQHRTPNTRTCRAECILKWNENRKEKKCLGEWFWTFNSSAT